LYKALSDGAKPQFSAIMKVLKAAGGQIKVNPVSAKKITTPQQQLRKHGAVIAIRKFSV